MNKLIRNFATSDYIVTSEAGYSHPASILKLTPSQLNQNQKGVTMKTSPTTTRKAKTILLLITLAALTLRNCTFRQEDSHPNDNPGAMNFSSSPVEQAFSGEHRDFLTGYAPSNSELR